MSNVQVAVRVRPLSKREREGGDRLVVEMRNKSTILSKTVSGLAVGETKDDSKEFLYDHSYWSVDVHDSHFVSQEQVYIDLGKSVLESAFQGYNACVFAYGQTGSGKTYTMMGSKDSPGLIPRICESLFAHIENGSKKNVSYKVEASYMEIYNEKVRDLLKSGSTPLKGQQLHNLKIREHPKEGPYVENLSWHTVSDFGSISSLMKMGNSHRVTASTKMNDVSSRSHAIFTLVFYQATYSSDLPCETVSKIHLVDLAGSERASATGAEGIRLKEGGNINRSLACLGNVISALADLSTSGRRSKEGDNKKPFIPYRDSVLTWLLKDSLGGNSKTIMVATISPAQENYGETLSTLRYASRAKNIVNKPVVNEDENVRLIRELRNEIKRLKAIIEHAKLEAPDMLLEDSMLEQNIHKNEERIAELTKTWAGKWDEDFQKAVEERNLALHSEGIKMTLESVRPYLLEMNNDGYKGVVTYHLKNGATTVGTQDASPEPDIALNGEGIKPHHCTITVEDDQNSKVQLTLGEGECFVNQSLATKNTDLSHGDLLQLGKVAIFRFYNPEEAKKLTGKPLTQRNFMYSLPLSPISSSVMPYDSHIQESEVQKDIPTVVQDVLDNDILNISFVQSSDSPVTPKAVETDSTMLSQGEGTSNTEDKERMEESMNSGAVLSTPTISSAFKETCPTATVCTEDSEVKEEMSVNQRQENEQRLLQENREMESRLTEEERKTKSLKNPLTDQEIQHQREQQALQSKLDHNQEEQSKDVVESRGRARSNAICENSSKPIQPGWSHLAGSSSNYSSGRIQVEIPKYVLITNGWSTHHEFEVQICASEDNWSINKSYAQFKKLHEEMIKKYDQVSALKFPPSKWFGTKSPAFVEQRRKQLQSYMKTLMTIATTLSTSPLYEISSRYLCKDKLIEFSLFFNDGKITGSDNVHIQN